MELRKTLAVWLTVMTAACSCNREAFKPVDNVVFIQDARLEEAGQTLSPGDAFHLHGIGCQQTDNVMLLGRPVTQLFLSVRCPVSMQRKKM